MLNSCSFEANQPDIVWEPCCSLSQTAVQCAAATEINEINHCLDAYKQRLTPMDLHPCMQYMCHICIRNKGNIGTWEQTWKTREQRKFEQSRHINCLHNFHNIKKQKETFGVYRVKSATWRICHNSLMSLADKE